MLLRLRCACLVVWSASARPQHPRALGFARQRLPLASRAAAATPARWTRVLSAMPPPHSPPTPAAAGTAAPMIEVERKFAAGCAASDLRARLEAAGAVLREPLLEVAIDVRIVSLNHWRVTAARRAARV